MMQKYVIERNDVVVFGPAPWTRTLARRVGLEGNAYPPEVPYSRGQFTMRAVVYDQLNDFQEHDDGALDGDVWRFSARLKPLADLKLLAKDRIDGIHDAMNRAAEANMRQGAKVTFDAALAANWTRRKNLLDAVDAAASVPQLNAVWQDRMNGWTV